MFEKLFKEPHNYFFKDNHILMYILYAYDSLRIHSQPKAQ